MVKFRPVDKLTLRNSKVYKNPVFVYGSLKFGFGNNSFLKEEYYRGKAQTFHPDYFLLSLGKFPAMVHLEGGSELHGIVGGELYFIRDETLDDLDRLEQNGRLYTRELIDISCSLGAPFKAWAYVMRTKVGPPYKGLKVLPKKTSHINYTWEKKDISR